MNSPYTVVLHDQTDDQGTPSAYPIYWVTCRDPERAGRTAAIKAARHRGYSLPRDELLNIVAVFPGFLLADI